MNDQIKQKDASAATVNYELEWLVMRLVIEKLI